MPGQQQPGRGHPRVPPPSGAGTLGDARHAGGDEPQLESRGHAFVGTAANPDDWHKGLDVPLFEAGTTEYLLWIGCGVRYEESAQQVARAMVRILNAAGVSFGILGEARCTGDPAKMGGNEMQFVDMARDNIVHADGSAMKAATHRRPGQAAGRAGV